MRNARAAWCLTLAALSLVAVSASAQTPGDRAALLAWNDSLASLTRELPSHIVKARGPQEDLTRLRNAFVFLRQGTVDSSARLLRQAGEEFYRVAGKHDDWPMAWYGIGLTERALARGAFPVLPARFHPLGADHNQGAIQAFVFAVQKDSTFLPGVEGLADAVQATTRWGYTGKARAALRGARVNSANTLLVRARLERDDDHRQRAVELLQRALQLGGDSGVVYQELSREQFALDRVTDASASYWAGVRLSTSPAAVNMLRGQLALIAAPGELTGFDTLPPLARTALVKRFWNLRDVDAGLPAGGRLREHYRRYELASVEYRPRQRGMTPVPLSTSGRMAAAFGYGPSPTTSSFYQSTSYPVSSFSQFVPSSFTVTRLGRPLADEPKSAFGLDDGFALVNTTSYGRFGVSSYRWGEGAIGGSLLYEMDFTAEEFDQRGQALLRYGRPSSTAGNLWVYNKGDSRLAVPVNGYAPGTPCDVILRYCTYENRGYIRPEEADRLRSELLAARDTLHATDQMIRPFARQLTPVVDAYAMIDGGSGEGRILVALAVPARQIQPTATETGFVYPLRIQLMAAPASGAYRVERDTTRLFYSDRLLGNDEYLQAVELLPVPAADYHFRVVVQTVDGMRGSVGGDDSVQVTSVRAGVALSDLVLGRDSSGLSWWNGTDRLKLNPSGHISREESLYLYYQLGGLPLGHSYRTSLEVFKATEPDGKPLISLSYDELADQPVMDIQRVLSLQPLKSGVHTIRLTIADAQGKVVAQRHASVKVE